MKAYTNIEQSKKLTEILPLDSADQTWERVAIAGANLDVPEEMEYWHNGNTPYILNSKIGIPCWSLAALLNYLREIDFFPEIDADKVMVTMNIKLLSLASIHNIKVKAENFIDACYDMIIKLHEQKLL